VVVYLLGIAALYTYFTNMTTWTMARTAPPWRQPRKASSRKCSVANTRPAKRRWGAHRHGTDINIRADRDRTVHQQRGLAVLRDLRASSVIFLLPYLLMFPRSPCSAQGPRQAPAFKIPAVTGS